MTELTIREPQIEDKVSFLAAMLRSEALHHSWVKPPLTADEFDEYIKRSKLPNQKNFFVCDETGNIAGVFNISEIVRGSFQNAYLGFYAVIDHANKGYMRDALKLVLEKAFKELHLHRLEANIQPGNFRSIDLVKKNHFRYEGFSPRYLNINGLWCGHEHWAITIEDYVRDDIEIIKKDYIHIIPYQTEWPEMAKTEIGKLKTVFSNIKIMDIQHVGSTAIPGIPAKPIIDIQMGVNSLEEIKPFAISALQKMGYEYWYENPDPTKMFFVKGMPPYGEKRTHHVHIFEYDSEHFRNKIIFRDYLRLHPDVARDYDKLKQQLAKEHVYDREKYTEAKLNFVNYVLNEANSLSIKK